MSPLAALVAHALTPRVLVLTFLVEWWTVWFICWRSFRATTGYTLAANGVVLGIPALLLAAGALGGHGRFEAAPLAWITAWLALLAGSVLAESRVVTVLMRRRRPGWEPSRYDLGLLAASRAAALAAAAADLWLSGASGGGT